MRQPSFFVSSLIAAGLAAPVHAQVSCKPDDTAPAANEIIVTARLREEPVREVPFAVVDAAIAAALGPLRHVRDPVLDIGAGTGLTTALIARAAPHAEILAIEPDPAMRSALMTRVWSDPDMRQRVTIMPMDALSAPLPERIAGAVLSASLVHFSPDERRCLWARLASRLHRKDGSSSSCRRLMPSMSHPREWRRSRSGGCATSARRKPGRWEATGRSGTSATAPNSTAFS